MALPKVIHFGTWDSKKDRTNKNEQTENRAVNYFEIELIISGNGTLFINEHSFKAFPGLLVIAKPGRQRKSICDFKTYFIHIEIDKSFEYYETLMNLPDFSYTTSSDLYIQIFTSIFSHLIDSNSDTSSIYFKAKFYELIYLLEKDSKNNIELISSHNIRKVNKQIRKVINYIEENYSEKITLASLAEITNYSPNYLQHIFSRIIGVSPNEYLTLERIKNAKQLLITTNKPIADISYECGFTSQAYFIKIFKSRTLCTPMEYRRMISGKNLFL